MEQTQQSDETNGTRAAAERWIHNVSWHFTPTVFALGNIEKTMLTVNFYAVLALYCIRVF